MMTLTINEGNIPLSLRKSKQWIVWNLEGKTDTFKGTKIPYQVKNPYLKASTIEEKNWAFFGEAAATAALHNMSGIGYVFTAEQGVVAIDIDGCVNSDGSISSPAKEALDLFQDKTYIEKSHSGKGFHILVKGDMPTARLKGIEIYNYGRYFAMTGDLVGTCKEITKLDGELNKLYTLYADTSKEWINPNWDIQKPTGQSLSLVDELNLRVEDIGYPGNAKEMGNGEIRGSHPFHGSTTGGNYAINKQKNVWICRRDGHNSGGGPLELFAVRSRIIQCEDARSGCLEGKWRDIFKSLKAAGYQVPERKEVHTANIGGTEAEPELILDPNVIPTYLFHDASVLTAVQKEAGQQGPLKIDYQKYTNFLKKAFHILVFNKTIYIYSQTEHIYKKNDNEVETHLRDVLRTYHVSGRLTYHSPEVIKHLLSMGMETVYPFNSISRTIPFNNCVVVLNYTTGEIEQKPFSYQYRFTYKLPFDYNANAPTDPILAVFRQWVKTETEVQTLVQYPAQCLIQTQEGIALKKAYCFEGPPDSGKTTYVSFVQRIFGEKFVSDVDLYTLCKDRFAFGYIEGKLANFHDEMDSFPIERLGMFKKLTGGIWHNIQHKGVDAYDGKLTCAHAFTCNKPPKIGDIDDTAFWKRWEYVLFYNTFERKDDFFKNTFTPATISGFYNLMLKMMIDIQQNKNLLVDTDADVIKDTWLPAAEPLIAFVEKNLGRITDEQVLTEDFYNGYLKYADETKIKVLPKNRVTTLLGEMKIQLSQPRINKKQVRVYKGITWFPNSKYKPISEVPVPEKNKLLSNFEAESNSGAT